MVMQPAQLTADTPPLPTGPTGGQQTVTAPVGAPTATRGGGTAAPPPTGAGVLGQPAGDLAVSDLIDAGLAQDVPTATKLLNQAKADRSGALMAQYRVAVQQAQQQEFLSLAGLSPTLADKMVYLTPQLPPGIAGPEPAPPGLAAPLTGGAASAAAQMTFASALANPRSMTTEQIGALQDQLVSAGMLQAGTFHRGYYDPATIKAYGGLLQDAMLMNQPVTQVLSAYTAHPLTGPVAPEVRADPLTVENYVRDTFQKAAGRYPSPEEMGSLINDYRGFEDKAYGAQVAAQKAQTAGTGGQITTYDPRTDLAAEIANSEPAQLYNFDSYSAAINHVLGK